MLARLEVMSDMKKRDELLNETKNFAAREAERNVNKYKQVVQSRSARVTSDGKHDEATLDAHSSEEINSEEDLRYMVSRQISKLDRK